MKVLLTAIGGWQTLAEGPIWALLLKITTILIAAWLVQLALVRANPRWRVLLWRVTAVALIGLPAVAWLFPAIHIEVKQPQPGEATAAVAASDATQANRTPISVKPVGISGDLPGTNTTELLPIIPNEQPGPMGNPEAAQDHVTASLAAKWPTITWPILMLVFWLAGVALLAFRLFVGHRRIERLVRLAKRPPQRVCGACIRVADSIGCRTPVELLHSADIPSPFLCGLRRPLLLFPTRMCEESYSNDLPGILAHELTHMRSHDILWNLGLQLMSILLWPHPLVWRIRKAHLAACELVCDAVSASFVGDVTAYCRTLARVAVDVCSPLPAAGIAMARNSAIGRRLSALKQRVFHLPLDRRNVLCFCLGALVAVTVLGTLQLVLAAPSAAEPPTGAVKTEAAKTPATIGSLLVRVVDGAGKPISGAKLRSDYRGGKVSGVTDSDGKTDLALPKPDAGYIYLYATVEGFVPLRKYWTNQDGREPRPDEFTFTFNSGRTIGGVVRDEQGKPISGAKVELNITPADYAQTGVAMTLWDFPLTTNAEGQWHLDHAPMKLDRLSMAVRHPDYISDGFLRSVSAQEQKQIEDRTSVIVLKRGIAVTGTVTDPDGNAVPGALVAQGDDRIGGSHFPAMRTDQQGHYRLGSFAPGGAVLTVISQGLAPAIRNLNVQPGMAPVDFRLTKGGLLRVRVVDKDGRPLQGVFVSPDTWRGHRTLTDLGIPKRTDAEGRWSWSWAPNDAVEMQIEKDGYMSPGTMRLAAQDTEQLITLYPALTITGHVVDAKTNQPIPNFQVLPGGVTNDDTNGARWNRMEMIEGKNGQYTVVISRPFTRPALTSYLVRVEADGYQPVVSRGFKSDEGSVSCDFSLTKGNVLNVSVRLPDGKPAVGADVCLCPEKPGKFYNMATFVKNGQFTYKDNFDSTKTYMKVGANGQLPIEPQDNGFLLIVVHDKGFAQTTSEDLKAKPEITLAAWARLDGVVRHGTKPVPNAKLDVYPRGSNGGMRWAFLNFQEQTEADAEGKFVFPKLKPGTWQIRLLPVDQSGRSPNEKSIELPPGQTVHVTLGGEGRPIIGRIQWPNGVSPDGDLSHIMAAIAPKMTEPPMPPKEVRDQGAEAIRDWMRKWQESPEGKTWISQAQQRQQSQRIGSVDRNGSLRVDNAVPGNYELSAMLKAKDGGLPWDEPALLRYSAEVSVPEMPGGVTDEPLDLGKVLLVDKTPKKPSSTSIKPPAAQAAGLKSTGKLLDNLDLLRYVVETNEQNKAKIKTWQGKASIERRQVYGKEAVGQDYSATVQFVFDRARKSIRWNTTLEKWARIVQGHDDPQPVPQIINGMMTPEGLYRFGSYGSPGNPKNRPLVLTITSGTLGNPQEGQLQPQQYDFNPLYFYSLNQQHGDLVEGLARYSDMANDPRMGVVKVVRDGDRVSIDTGMGNMSTRYTLSLNQGCNLIEYKSAWPESSAEYHWTYELRDGIWLPKTWTQAVHYKGGQDEQGKVTFVENVVNQPVDPTAFSLGRLGLQPGDKVQDRRTQPMNQYQYEAE